MPTGIVMSSGSVGATKEAIEEVLERNGHAVEREEPATVEATEPKREEFESDEEFNGAVKDWKLAHGEKVEEEKPAAAAGEKTAEELAEENRQRPSRMQRKIDRATRELQQQLADANARIAALEGKKPEELEVEENPRPKKADYKSDEEYEDALLAWGTAKALTEQAMKNAQQSEQERLQENYDSYRAQVEDFKDEHDDWDEVVNQDIPMHTGVQLAIMEQENGAEVTYYLGTHPDYAIQLAEMSPLSAVMEVGRLSERLKTGAPKPGAENGKTATEKPKPKVLPAPVRPVNTAATTASSPTSREAAASRNYREFKRAQRAGR